MAKRKGPKKRRDQGDIGTVFSLAEGLTALLLGASEYCTPGHRMGKGYRLLINGIVEATATDVLLPYRLELTEVVGASQ